MNEEQLVQMTGELCGMRCDVGMSVCRGIGGLWVAAFAVFIRTPISRFPLSKNFR